MTLRTVQQAATVPVFRQERPLPDIARRVFTADDILAQRKLARHLLGWGADYMFTLKDIRKTLRQNIQLLCDEMIRWRAPRHVQEPGKPEHGGTGRRSVRASSEVTEAKTGEMGAETACGVTSLRSEAASPKRLLELNRGHWQVESSHHNPGWSFDGDRSRIRTGRGPGKPTLP